MLTDEIYNFLSQYNWKVLSRMYGNSHSSIIGFISNGWLAKGNNCFIFDGAPASNIGSGREGQRNADILLCKNEKPYAVVEVETNVSKYKDKIDSIISYMDSNNDFNGIRFGLMIMANFRTKERKYKHNWDEIKRYIAEKEKYPIALVSIEKSIMSLDDNVLDLLRKRNEYYSHTVDRIDYWIYDKKISEGNLLDIRKAIDLKDDSNIEKIIREINKDEFTVLDVYDFIKGNYIATWNELVNESKLRKSNYTIKNYLSNIIIKYSKKQHSII
ncbi:MAG: hypothetical protein PWP07_1596 [Epulopiscium sp.]|uniref:Uncharacterized protein n=1 Tax=Defluviitalea raffinosedens TaxID=1450156 RepID=A0A7C8LIX9_9FIRM|nr:hypothetical protein [Defluviitalea raffinosedens]KAE9637120.1 hypothetical protein GND95_01425 [Defluviitalea raffinosedens]MDK2788351.1 hypothetical protein [Candidatus Epulonipiscium sp.]HHW66858.1 hypothetical protein [Candidatus Epulonipiscium sp.]